MVDRSGQRILTIRKLRHQVVLCSQQDQIDENGDMILNRKAVWRAWADIQQKHAQTYSDHGATFMATTRNIRSHIIRVRYNWTLDITAYAWIFEKRLRSPPRWFKILGVDQSEDRGSYYYQFDARLIERSDNAIEPAEEEETCVAKALPPGVKL